MLIPIGVSGATKPLLEARLLLFALTPSPSPTLWERGVMRVRSATVPPLPRRGRGG